MAEIKISCSHCSQHIQCDESYGGQQIQCPSCSQPLLIPQILKSELLPTATPALPNAPIPNIKRRQKPDYLAEVKNWDSGDSEQIPPQISPLRDADNETPASWNPAAAACMVLGVICYAFGLVDFAGMPFHYDITGVSWSPIVAGLIGSAMVGAGYKLNKGREPISNSAITITLMLVGLVTAGSIYYFSSGGRLFTPISSLESQVKADIQTKLAQDPATSSIQIKSFSLVHESGNKYKGILEAQTDGNKESAEVEVTYDGRTFMWKILPQASQNSADGQAGTPPPLVDPNTGLPAVPPIDPTTGLPLSSSSADNSTQTALDPATGLPMAPAAVQTDWNMQEIDAMKNGNISFAVQTVLANPDLRSQAKMQDPQTVAKTPWHYYGQVVKLTGRVVDVEDCPAGSDFSKLIGGRDVTDIVVSSQDGTIIELFCMKLSGSMKIGNTVNLYGYPVGETDVPNKRGGNSNHLILVGNDYDDFGAR